MNAIKPIVGISKISDGYDTIVIGFRGVLYDGMSLKQEAISAVLNLKKQGKRLVLLTNSHMRIAKIVKFLEQNGLPSFVWDSVVTSGEIVHYKLKCKKGEFEALGSKFYCVGSSKDLDVFHGLYYEKVDDISKADFLYLTEVNSASDVLEDYLGKLEYGVNMGLPLLCTGNDSSSYMDGTVCLSSGSIAEQYATMGGKIITVGKPDPRVVAYSLDGLDKLEKSKILLIGDSLSSDIKGAMLMGVDSVLISKGIHVNFLGEGYIPDVTKAKELAENFEAYPNFIISSFRW